MTGVEGSGVRGREDEAECESESTPVRIGRGLTVDGALDEGGLGITRCCCCCVCDDGVLLGEGAGTSKSDCSRSEVSSADEVMVMEPPFGYKVRGSGQPLRPL
jgi:hypothetical protein